MIDWITIVLIPIAVGIFVNALNSQEKENEEIYKQQVAGCRHTFDKYILKIESSKNKAEQIFWCNQALELINTMFLLHLRERGCKKALIEQLCTMQELCMQIMEEDKACNRSRGIIYKLKENINCFYDMLVLGSTSYIKRKDILSKRNKSLLFLVNIIIVTVVISWGVYKGFVSNNIFLFILIAGCTFINWITQLLIIYLINYIMDIIDNKNNRKKEKGNGKEV